MLPGCWESVCIKVMISPVHIWSLTQKLIRQCVPSICNLPVCSSEVKIVLTVVLRHCKLIFIESGDLLETDRNTVAQRQRRRDNYYCSGSAGWAGLPPSPDCVKPSSLHLMWQFWTWWYEDKTIIQNTQGGGRGEGEATLYRYCTTIDII